jgi:hypothetical protein
MTELKTQNSKLQDERESEVVKIRALERQKEDYANKSKIAEETAGAYKK